jgi:REP element-mobilizing transposase RayT
MGRNVRANLPGVAFHLTTRLQAREPLFLGLERSVVELIAESTELARVPLLAYAIMPNHLHLVVVQGRSPLAGLMQALLRRAALLVARANKREGHVFERRYRDKPCLDPAYLRTAIAYVHLNPVRAGLCASPDACQWTSHRAYAGDPVGPTYVPAGIHLGLGLFAESEREGCDGWHQSYLRFVTWRRAMDRYLESGGEEDAPAAPLRPYAAGGDDHWVTYFDDAAARAHSMLADPAEAALRPDLATIAKTVLSAETGNDMDLRCLRSGDRGRALVRVRREFIDRCLTAGYGNGQIARFLRVSTGVVSFVAARQRDRLREHSSMRRPSAESGRFEHLVPGPSGWS